MEQDVEDGQVFTFSVHYSNIVDSDKTPTIGPTLVIDREKGKIEPSPLLRKGRRPTKSRRAPEPPQKIPDIDKLNNNATPVVQANGALPPELPVTYLNNGSLYKELPEHQSSHDGTVQSLGLTNTILPQEDLSFYRNRVSSLTAHEIALDLSDQRNSCTVPLTPQANGKKRHHSTPALVTGRTRMTSTSSLPVANGKQRHSSALERRPAVVGDGSVALCETPGTPNKLPLVARKMAVGRPLCIFLLVVLAILLLLVIFVPVAWVVGRDDGDRVDAGMIIGTDMSGAFTESVYTTQGILESTYSSDMRFSTAIPNLFSTDNELSDERTTSRRPTVSSRPTTNVPLHQTQRTTQTHSRTQSITTGDSRTAAPVVTTESQVARTSVADDRGVGPESTINPDIPESGLNTAGLGASSLSENISPNADVSSAGLPEAPWPTTPSDGATSADFGDSNAGQTMSAALLDAFHDTPSTSVPVTSSSLDFRTSAHAQTSGDFDITTERFTNVSSHNFR